MAYLYQMKKILSGLFCLVCFQIASAQKELLRFDEVNKYVYYQVVEKAGLSADTLYKRGLGFAHVTYPKSKVENTGSNAFTIKAKFPVYNGASVVKKEAGEVCYALFIETKDQKYRYKITAMVFTPYKRDRFNNMAAQPGIEIPVEKLASRYTQKEADNYLDQTGAFCKATGELLKKYMDNAPALPKTSAVKKVVTDKW